MKRTFLPILLLIILISPTSAAELYKWVDDKGVVNFTDDFEKVPLRYRSQIKREEMKDIPEEAVTPQDQEASPKSEEIEKDLLGRDEVWWREKLGQWRERLKEAQSNFEIANRKYMERSEELNQKRFGSLTRRDYNELDTLNKDRKKCENQITEAKEMLEKLSKEAESSKANPEWLR